MCGGRSRRFYRRRRTTPASGDGGGGQRANSAGHAAPTSSSRPEGERGEGSLPCDEGGRQEGKVHSSLVWRNGPRSPPGGGDDPCKKLRLRHDRLERVGGKPLSRERENLFFLKK